MFAKVFKSGNSLALRIHKKICIYHGKNNTIILEKITTDWGNIFYKCYSPDFQEHENMKFAIRDKL